MDPGDNGDILAIIIEDFPAALEVGLQAIIRSYPDRVERASQRKCRYALHLRFSAKSLSPNRLVVHAHPHSNNNTSPNDSNYDVHIEYTHPTMAFRALGRILGVQASMSSLRPPPSDYLIKSLSFEEEASFDTISVMLDCSRGAVPLVSTVQNILVRCALMGFNTFLLYTEDTYQVKDEPMFGYLRGPYSHDELKMIDDAAFALGLEVIPCIQTLGHLGQILQWPRYSTLRDTSEILLPMYGDTYVFLEKIIQAATSPFRSNKIHIGMDEAHGLGEGRYRQIFGPDDGTKIFLNHLNRVVDICKKFQLAPMIWSDMLFCLAAKNNSLNAYYEHSSNNMSHEVSTTLNDNSITLVFWDYYHTDPDLYAKKIREHRDLGCAEPWIASGVWTWNRFWAQHSFTKQAIHACMQACKKPNERVKNVMVTIWGDDGSECDMYSMFPGLQYFAEHSFTPELDIDDELMKRNFFGIIEADYDSWVKGSKIDDIGTEIIVRDQKTHYPANTSKWMLWEDPVLAFLDTQLPPQMNMEEYYSTLATELVQAAEKSKSRWLKGNKRLIFPALIASTLAIKCYLRPQLTEAYKAGDKQRLSELNNFRVKRLIDMVDRLWHHHRAMWLSTNKPFGLEVIELRYGGLRTRLQSLYERLKSYIKSDEWSSLRSYSVRDISMAESPSFNERQHSRVSLKSDTSMIVDMLEPLSLTFESSSGIFSDHVVGEERHLVEMQAGFPEWEVPLQTIYENAGPNLSLNYVRCSTPSRNALYFKSVQTRHEDEDMLTISTSSPSSSGDSPTMSDPCPFHQDHAIQWPDLINIISSTRLHWLNRSEAETKRYEMWTRQVTGEYVGADDYLANVLFGWELVREYEYEEKVDEQRGEGEEGGTSDTDRQRTGGRKKVKVPEERKGHLVLKMNDFPYSLADGIIHYCLWCDKSVDEETVRWYAKTTFPHHDTVWWINPTSRKTIKSIWHAHILVKYR